MVRSAHGSLARLQRPRPPGRSSNSSTGERRSGLTSRTRRALGLVSDKATGRRSGPVVTSTRAHAKLCCLPGTNGATGAPLQEQEIRLFPGPNILRLDAPLPVVGGREYFFALYSDDTFVWPMLYKGLAPPAGVEMGAFAADRTGRSFAWFSVLYCHFGFDLAILPTTATSAATWGFVKTLYRDARVLPWGTGSAPPLTRRCTRRASESERGSSSRLAFDARG